MRPSREASSGFVRSLLGAALALVAVSLAPAAERTAFVFNDPGHAWRATPVGRPASPQLLIEQILEPATGRSRIVVVSSRASDDAPASLEIFAHAIKRVFAAGAGPDTLDAETSRLGFVGHELHFPLARETGSFDCELFVFADGGSQRGILCAAAQNDPAAAYSLLARFQRPPTVPASVSASTPEGVVVLAPLKVRDNAVSDFAISFRIIASREHHRVVKLIVTDVPDSGASASRIAVGDEIAAIDGRAIQEFDSAVGRNTELGRIFLNRRLGDSVALDLVSARDREPYTVTLRVEDFRQWLKR